MSIGSPGFHFSPSGLPDVKDLDLATDIRLQAWQIVRGVTIPYCAGYHETKRIIYVDDAVPDTWDVDGRILQVVRGSLFWHESLESDLMLSYPDEHYEGAHTAATIMEDAYVRAHGFDSTRYEDEFWAPIIAECGSRKSYPRVPRGLNLRPYQQEGDEILLRRMKFVDA